MALSGSLSEMQSYLKKNQAVRDFQGLWKTIRVVSKQNGLEDLWSATEKQLRELLVQWGDDVEPRTKTYVSYHFLTKNLLFTSQVTCSKTHKSHYKVK